VFLHEEDASTWDNERVQKTLEAYAAHPFDLTTGPLLRFYLFKRSAQEQVLMLVIHHLIADLWTLTQLVKELQECYSMLKAGKPVNLPPVRWHYSDHVRWQADMLRSPQSQQRQTFWQEQLSGDLPVLQLPADHPRPAAQTYHGATHAFTLDPELTQRLQSLLRTQGITLYTFLLSAFQILLYRYTGQEDILIGSPTTGRYRAETEQIAGYFVNPIVLRAKVSGQLPFLTFLQQNRQTVLAALAHQDYPFPLLVEQLAPDRHPGRTPLFQTMFVLQQARQAREITAFLAGEPSARITSGDLQLAPHPLAQHTAQFDLTLEMVAAEQCIAGHFVYNTDLFTSATIERMASGWLRMVTSIVAQPEQSIHQLPVISPAEEAALLALSERQSITVAPDICLHQLVEAQVARTPRAVAMRFHAQELTYQSINQRANRLAHSLQRLGVGPETLVGICLPRTPELFISMLAILKAGGAYVPLDPTYPPQRLAYVLEDTQLQIIVTQEYLQDLFPAYTGQYLLLDQSSRELLCERDDNPVTTVQPENLAYVIYTSGSTGRPKGASIRHSSVVTFIHWSHTIYEPQATAGTLASTSINFDLSVYEFFTPLSNGGKVILVENALSLLDEPVTADITLLNTVPSAITELLQRQSIPETAHVINLAGEPLHNSLVQNLYQLSHITAIYNLYGPAEATTYSTYARLQPGATSTPPIGTPIANTRLLLLDRDLQLTPRGVAGEVYIGGAGLARGYYNQPALTAERFIPDRYSTCPGARLYKTGDIARYLPDGNLEYLGRNDDQIKIRGMRVELSEIEIALHRSPAVRDAVVLIRESASGTDKRLVAYLVPHQQQAFSIAELRHFLQTQLPGHMLPAHFLLLEVLPSTQNGKVDRQQLLTMELPASLPEAAFVAPRTSLEQDLAAIWSDVLEIERIGVYDNFFELGGHSLSASRVIARVRTAFAIELRLQAIFLRPTIAHMAEELEQALVMEASTEEIDAFLSLIASDPATRE
jgi:amino acid adenylation domain-containing protein